MPTYRYRCGACGEELEVWQSITDDALTAHEICGGSLVKVLSPAGIVLKGSGFYKTDSRSGASGNGKGTGKDTGKDAPSKSGDAGSSGSTGSSDSSGSGSSSSGSSSTTGGPSKSGSSSSTGSSTPSGAST